MSHAVAGGCGRWPGTALRGSACIVESSIMYATNDVLHHSACIARYSPEELGPARFRLGRRAPPGGSWEGTV